MKYTGFEKINKIIVFTLIISLFFACNKEEPGEPYAQFVVNGKVKDFVYDEGIPGIEIFASIRGENDTTLYNLNKVYSDFNGNFQIDFLSSPDKYTYYFEIKDIDGGSYGFYTGIKDTVTFGDPVYEGQTSDEMFKGSSIESIEFRLQTSIK